MARPTASAARVLGRRAQGLDRSEQHLAALRIDLERAQKDVGGARLVFGAVAEQLRGIPELRDALGQRRVEIRVLDERLGELPSRCVQK